MKLNVFDPRACSPLSCSTKSQRESKIPALTPSHVSLSLLAVRWSIGLEGAPYLRRLKARAAESGRIFVVPVARSTSARSNPPGWVTVSLNPLFWVDRSMTTPWRSLLTRVPPELQGSFEARPSIPVWERFSSVGDTDPIVYTHSDLHCLPSHPVSLAAPLFSIVIIWRSRPAQP